MTAPVRKKRLDAMELQLTPKEWAINLAHEMRLHPSEAEFARVVADKPYREWPWVKPFFKLCEQAEVRYPGNRPENISARNESARRLRTEFHSLKKLILKTNEIIRRKTEAIKLETRLKLALLHTLVLQDAIVRTARKTTEWAKHFESIDAEENEARQLIVKELGTYTEIGLALNGNFPSLLENSVDELAMLLMDVYTHRAVVSKIQEKYFDGHPFLYCDVESKLVETIKLLEDAASTFNEYFATRAALSKAESGPEDCTGDVPAIPGEAEGHLAIDAEFLRLRVGDFLVDHAADEWAKESRENAKADTLQETGEHERHIWQIFRNRAKQEGPW
jgi:hypothetical protein